MQILSTGASRIPEAFHAQFPVFATPRPTKLLVAREKKPLPKVAEVFCRRAAVSTAVLTTTPCARWAPNENKMRFLRGWSAAIFFSCLSAWLVPIFFLRYRHKNKKMTRKIMFYPVLIQKQRELVYCYQTRGWVQKACLHFTSNDVYSAFQVRPFDKTFSNSLIVRPIKHPSCKCHEYVYMCDMKTFVLDKKCANHDHRVRAHRYLITPWFVSVPGKHVYYFSFSSFVLLLGILNCRTFCSYVSMELCSCR